MMRPSISSLNTLPLTNRSFSNTPKLKSRRYVVVCKLPIYSSQSPIVMKACLWFEYGFHEVKSNCPTEMYCVSFNARFLTFIHYLETRNAQNSRACFHDILLVGIWTSRFATKRIEFPSGNHGPVAIVVVATMNMPPGTYLFAFVLCHSHIYMENGDTLLQSHINPTWL